VEYGGEGVIFDPTSNSLRHPVFVSHAHADHAAAFRYPDLVKYATEPTHRLLEALGWKRADGWHPISVGDKVKVGDIEVRIHNAGHILGSVQFEAATPEGTVLYTGDFSLGDSYTMAAAEPVRCDLLVIETTFGSPMFTFPKRKEVALEMVRWAVLEAVPGGRVPVFKTDSIGNAQEIISIFNRMTKLPVVTAKSATRASDVYREYGHRLDYIHADFRGLLSFIRRCHPKRVLTFHGGALTRDFAGYVKKRLGIDARPLTRREETLMGPVSRSEVRMRACCDQLLRTLRIPGFVYTNPWLVREMARRGFTRSETEAALRRLIDQGLLTPAGSGVKLG